jgi:four helix bundle protein
MAWRMKAKKLDDVLVYTKSLVGADAVSAMLERPAFRRDFKLKDQLSQSSSRTVALIAEGFGQLTDRHTASYYANARGSAMETIGHLHVARGRHHITDEERSTVAAVYDEINVDELDQLPGRVRLEKTQLKSPLLARSRRRPIASSLSPSACRLRLSPSACRP